jgi:hypothetical protein
MQEDREEKRVKNRDVRKGRMGRSKWKKKGEKVES